MGTWPSCIDSYSWNRSGQRQYVNIMSEMKERCRRTEARTINTLKRYAFHHRPGAVQPARRLLMNCVDWSAVRVWPYPRTAVRRVMECGARPCRYVTRHWLRRKILQCSHYSVHFVICIWLSFASFSCRINSLQTCVLYSRRFLSSNICSLHCHQGCRIGF